MMNDYSTIAGGYYGDETRWFIGSVVSHTPPYGFEGRVKVRIHGVHSSKISEVSDADLPWAQVVLPTTEGGTSGIGRTPQLLSGALVFGLFLDGKTSQIPIVIGSLPKREMPTGIQQENRLNPNSANSASGTQSEDLDVLTMVSDNIADTATQRLRRRSEAMKFFIDNGYTIEQAAGITGNIDSVSGFETQVDTSDEDGSKKITAIYTVCKWSESRLRDLKIFAGNYNKNLNNGGIDIGSRFSYNNDSDLQSDINQQLKDTVYLKYIIQLKFILQELRTTKVVANGKLLKSMVVSGRNGSAEIIRNYYIDTKSRPEKQLALDNSLLAREELYTL